MAVGGKDVIRGLGRKPQIGRGSFVACRRTELSDTRMIEHTERVCFGALLYVDDSKIRSYYVNILKKSYTL